MKLIQDWQGKRLVCSKCGTIRSVKYSDGDGVVYCNACVLQFPNMEENREHMAVTHKET